MTDGVKEPAPEDSSEDDELEDDEEYEDGDEGDGEEEAPLQPVGDGFVFFPDPRVTAEIAKIEAAPPEAAQTFSWVRSIAFAVVFALAGSALYAGVVYAMEMELGIVSIVIGVLAGIGAARGGRGRKAQVIGAVAAAVGYFAGQIMAIAAMVGGQFFDVPASAYGDLMVVLVKETFSSMGVLFLGIAVYEGWVIPRSQS